MITPEFSRPIQVVNLPPGVTKFEVTAEADELAALARRFELIDLSELTATVVLATESNGLRIVVDGTFDATVQQQCVITLETIDNKISASFHCIYSANAVQAEELEVELAWDAEDPDEPIIDGVIDIGEIVAERLGLEIDPFPKSRDVRFEGYEVNGANKEEKSNSEGPFAQLRALRDKKS